MKRCIFGIFVAFFPLVSIPLFAQNVTASEQLPAYYATMNGKAEKALFDEVHVIVKVGYSSLGYKGLWTAYQTTDLNADGKIWDMYSNCDFVYSNDQCGNYSSECDCYNREHSIPKSWFGGATSGPGCDIFHLVPTDGKVNGMRSNYAFGEVSNATYTYDGSQLGSAASIPITGGKTLAGNEGTTVSCSGTVFEPQDQYKGDFARGYMGALLKWAGDYQAFTSGDGSKIFSGNYTATGKFGLTNYGIALLMKWHREDPVSQKEIDRNNGIQATQGNRNPFIDYPYLAEYIWGSHAGEAVDMSLLLCSSDAAFVPGVSNGYDGSGGGTVPEPEETWQITWQVDGEVYTDGNPTMKVVKGKGVEVLPAEPTSCSATSTVFVGWTTELIAGTTDMAPEVLFADVANAPEIKSDMTFHAVFAKGDETATTYTEYLTTCTSTQIEETHTADTRLRPQKVLRDGQLLIIVDGKTYTVYGILR